MLVNDNKEAKVNILTQTSMKTNVNYINQPRLNEQE